MNSSVIEVKPLAQDVLVTDAELIVDLADGRKISVPLVWFPRLLHAEKSQRANRVPIGDGEGMHWPDVDDDLSVAGLLRGAPAVGSGRSA